MKVAHSSPTFCNPMDYIVHGILQARILEWVAFPFSRGSSQPRDQTQVSHTAGGFFYQLSHKGSPLKRDFKKGLIKLFRWWINSKTVCWFWKQSKFVLRKQKKNLKWFRQGLESTYEVRFLISYPGFKLSVSLALALSTGWLYELFIQLRRDFSKL